MKKLLLLVALLLLPNTTLASKDDTRLAEMVISFQSHALRVSSLMSMLLYNAATLPPKKQVPAMQALGQLGVFNQKLLENLGTPLRKRYPRKMVIKAILEVSNDIEVFYVLLNTLSTIHTDPTQKKIFDAMRSGNHKMFKSLVVLFVDRFVAPKSIKKRPKKHPKGKAI
jgi:hypothetical protein